MTAFIYRILLLYPESRKQEIDTWYSEQFPDAGDLLTPCGTKDGEDWYVTSFVATKADMAKWMGRFGNEIQTPIPDGFLDFPRSNQMGALDGFRQAAQQHLGIWIDACWNDEGQMCDYEAALTAMGVARWDGVG
jgi:hypothetical protein